MTGRAEIDSGDPLDLSIVLPAYRAAATASESVSELCAHLSRLRGLTWEVIVVDDGGFDFPDGCFEHLQHVRLLHHAENRGKGAAVMTGLGAARGRAHVYTDVDIPYGVDSLLVAYEYIRSGYQVVVGDRTLPNSDYRLHLSWGRRLLSTSSAIIAGTLVTGGIFDTQCGLKAFEGRVSHTLTRLVRANRFAFDLEVVYLVLRYNCALRRIPVRFQSDVTTSSVRPFRDGFQAAIDVLRIKKTALSGGYDSPELQALVDEELAGHTASKEASSKGP